MVCPVHLAEIQHQPRRLIQHPHPPGHRLRDRQPDFQPGARVPDRGRPRIQPCQCRQTVLRQNRPRTTLDIELTRVQSGPLLRQLLHKEMVEGLLSATVTARFNGDTWPLIRKTLSGKGALNFSDGAIVGIDLADMARNVQSAFGLADKPAVKPKTDFSELSVPFTLTNGLARVTGATLNAPLLRVAAEGTAHLVTEALDLRVEPKFVGTLVGQGDTRQRSGVAVPVLVGGTFSEPTFRPDLKGMLQQQLKDPRVIEKLVPEGKARDILRALPFGTRP